MDRSRRENRVVAAGDGRVRIFAGAKLNLGLRVFPVRADGFHDVETWMVPVSWRDTVWITPGGRLELVVSGRAQGVPREIEKNLVGRAAVLLAAKAKVEATGRIELQKELPAGGGIGGGSSDAASVLVGLNEVWGLGWDEGRLGEVAAELGSDVPFFVGARPSLCRGRGEIMTGLRGEHPIFAVLIVPGEGCSTKEVFGAFDAGHRFGSGERTDWKELAGARAEQLNEMLVNDLEPAAFRVAPWLGALRKKAAGAAGQRVHLTGSGSTLFTLCSSMKRAAELEAGLRDGLGDGVRVVGVEVLQD